MSLHSLTNIHEVKVLQQITGITNNLDTRRTWRVARRLSCRISQVGVIEDKTFVERTFIYSWQIWSDREMSLPVDTRISYDGKILRVVQGEINAGSLNRIWYALLHEFDVDQYDVEL